MKKSILNLGKLLTKSEQKNIFGGNDTLGDVICQTGSFPCTCPDGNTFCAISANLCVLTCEFS